MSLGLTKIHDRFTITSPCYNRLTNRCCNTEGWRSLSRRISNLIEIYRVTKDKFTLKSSNVYKSKVRTLVLLVLTYGEFSCSWRQVISYRVFASPCILEVDPLGETLSTRTSKENWGLWPPLPLPCLYLEQYLKKWPHWTHLNQPLEISRHFSGWFALYLEHVGVQLAFFPHYLGIEKVSFEVLWIFNP